METQARYTLIGLFTLAVIAAGFLFVYWLHGTGGLRQQAVYRIRFQDSVGGLLKGSSVLFNGIRVGEVTALDLSAADPHEVTATIAIDPKTPIRSDTKIGVEFQGLMGAPAIALNGGSPGAPAPAGAQGEAPLLAAERDAGRPVSEAAREVLRRMDTILLENSEPLHGLITNINTFAAVLARNSERVDGIVAGLERLTGASKPPPPRIYELSAARDLRAFEKIPVGQLVIPEPTSLSVFDTDKILVRAKAGESPTLANAQWPDVIPKLVQARIIQSFENAKYLRVLARSPDGLTPEHQLLVDIRQFQISMQPDAVAEVEFAAKLLTGDGRIVDARVFRASAPGNATDPALAAAALSQAFSRAAGELVSWAGAKM